VNKDHYAFKPISQNARIWHYMNFPKFVLLLEKRALYFSLLKKLQDKYEGNKTQAENDQDKSMFEYWESISPNINAEEEERRERQKTENKKSLIRVNC
jgi:hypothetical protein